MLAASSSQFAVESTCPRIRHIVTGAFNTDALYVLGYDTLDSSLQVQRRVEGEGPHQFLALGRTESGGKTVYATTWAERKSLSAWKVVDPVSQESGETDPMDLVRINTVDITATSSYVHVQPPPYSAVTAPAYAVAPGVARYLYSAGGPTGELHALDPQTGRILSKTEEYVYLPAGAAALAEADKSRRALRYGAHNLDFGPNEIAYVADLGRNAILLYTYDERESGTLRQVLEVKSPREGDGPRHIVPSPCGRFFFSVTEHTSWVDVFRLSPPTPSTDGWDATYIESLDILPPGMDRHQYRGDTLRISPDGTAILASTRGMTNEVRGFVTAWRLDLSLGSALASPVVDAATPLDRYETRNSGGKANAIEWAPRYPLAGPQQGFLPGTEQQQQQQKGGDLLVLTDDQDGWIVVLEWTGEKLVEKAEVKLPAETSEGSDGGASHAIWLD